MSGYGGGSAQCRGRVRPILLQGLELAQEAIRLPLGMEAQVTPVLIPANAPAPAPAVPDEEIENPPVFADEEERAYITEKVLAVDRMLPQIDEKINAVARGWRTGRMARTDLALLRLAVYEITCDEDIPAGVAINEAVELSKQYGSDSSSTNRANPM